MSFTKKVQDLALVRSKRHCGVCYRFCGRNIELHHIIPKSKEGKDTIENCIPLCFDCHADVGHYNINHPKGKKFSPEELKHHRDKLYSLIEKGIIPTHNSIEYPKSSLVIANIDIDEFNCLWDRLENSSSNIEFAFHELELFRWSREEIENENRTLDPIFDITLLNPTPLPITLNRIGIFLLDYWQKLKGIATPKKVFISDSYRINLTSLKKKTKQYFKLPNPVIIPSMSPYRFTFCLENYHEAAPANCVVVETFFDSSMGELQSSPILLGSF